MTRAGDHQTTGRATARQASSGSAGSRRAPADATLLLTRGIGDFGHDQELSVRATRVVDALSGLADAAVPLPASGDLRGDLAALAQTTSRALDADPRLRALLRELIALQGADQVHVAQPFWQRQSRRVSTLTQRAALRGEIPSSRAGSRVLEAVLAPVLLRAAMGQPQLTARQIAAQADDAATLACDADRPR